MSRALAWALMQLALCSLGHSRREWGLAMRAEYEEAARSGDPLLFAAGCLIAAWREAPRHAEGRYGIATHLLALGLLVPIAFLQFAYVIGLTMGPTGSYFMLTPAGSTVRMAADAQLSGIPAMLILWTLLGIAHLRLAWALLDDDWDRVARIAAMIAASTLTLVIFMQILLLSIGTLLLQAGALTIELVVILAVARWHGRLARQTSPDLFAA